MGWFPRWGQQDRGAVPPRPTEDLSSSTAETPPESATPAPATPPRVTKTGSRVINAAELDHSKANIISAKRVDTRTLLYTGDTVDERRRKRELAEAGEENVVYGKDSKRCNVCCMMHGAVMSAALSMFLSAGQTALFAYREQHRITITVAKFCRHTAWIMIPPAMVGATLHWFLVEAFWSKRRNTFGMAWAKAVIMNTAAWLTVIAMSTLVWRYGLRLTSFGSKLYYRYPAAAESLELRVMENPKAIFTGMTWTYWALGLISGQAGYCACVGMAVSQNRVHTLMSPVGTYAVACAPWWRREAIAASAGMTLRHIEQQPSTGSTPGN